MCLHKHVAVKVSHVCNLVIFAYLSSKPDLCLALFQLRETFEAFPTLSLPPPRFPSSRDGTAGPRSV